MSTEITGYIASTLALLTFMTKDMRLLRIIAILSNVAFIAYGTLCGLAPIFCLHLLLLPLNVIRLKQLPSTAGKGDRSGAAGLCRFVLLWWSHIPRPVWLARAPL